MKKLPGLLIVGVVLLIEVYTAGAQNKVIYVPQCTEAGLLAAINVARDNDIIQFSCDGRIRFTKVRKITRSVVLDATDRKVTLDGLGNTGIIEIAPSVRVVLRNLKFTDAGIRGDEFRVLPDFTGRAIVNYGSLAVHKCTFEDNVSAFGYEGAAIANYGWLSIEDSYFARNVANRGPGPRASTSGGAIANVGTAVIKNSTFIENISGAGGAITNAGGLSIYQSTFTKNSAGTYDCFQCGGAISNSGLMYLENSTIVANKYYGIVNFGTATIISSTIADNTTSYYAPSEHIVYSNILNLGVLTLRNSIIAGTRIKPSPDINPTIMNEVARNCVSKLPSFVGGKNAILDGGYNLQYPEDSCLKTRPVANPKLMPLGDYGSAQKQGVEGYPVPILGLHPDSPAINQGQCVYDPEEIASYGLRVLDGRGFSRSTDAKCDIGAFEFGAVPPEQLPTKTPFPMPAPNPTPS